MKHVFNHNVARLLTLALLSGPGCRAGEDAAAAQSPALVYHEIGASGAVVDTHEADRPFNPASVVKVATTLRALETLGPDHRFVTRFGYRGRLDPATGVLDGDLVVAGGADPDFHVENAYLVARELNRLRVRDVRGRIRVDDRFWIGWEGGSEKRTHDPEVRATGMAERLRDAFDPARWTAGTRKGIDEFRGRRSLDAEPLPAVVVHGTPGREREVGKADDVTWLIEHRSNPVVLTLKRFNSFSNNDIERFAESIGDAGELAAVLTARLQRDDADVRVATLSGLGSNRLDARAVVDLLDALQKTCVRLGLTPGDVLPVSGCDPGTLTNFPRIDTEAFRGALVAKTGSLNETDGGVAVLAGILETQQGRHVFCVASPQAGGRLPTARTAQESWLLDRIAAAGGPRPGACPAALPYSDIDVSVGSIENAVTGADTP